MNNEEKNMNKTKCVSIRNQHIVMGEKKKNLDVILFLKFSKKIFLIINIKKLRLVREKK